MQEKKRGTYKIDEMLTPLENTLKALKTAFPIDMALAKLGGNYECTDHNIKLNNIGIYPANKLKGHTDYHKCFDRVIFNIALPWRYGRRQNSKSWSVPVLNGAISLSWIHRVMTDLVRIHTAEYAVENARKEVIRIEEKRMEVVRAKVKLPRGCSLYSYTKEDYQITISSLDEEAAIKVGNLLERFYNS